MTELQKRKIESLRRNGHKQLDIANAVGLPVNTVKSYLRRNENMQPTDNLCRNCGKPFKQNPHTRKQDFCSNHCRQIWWNSNRDQIDHHDRRTMECVYCGQEFEAHGKRQRKYCSLECCAADRGG